MNQAQTSLRSWGIGLILAGALGLAFFGYQEMTPQAVSNSPETLKREACLVLSVYDGDTVGCDLNGNRRVDRPGEVVRLLGIDTPEMHYSKKNPTHGSDHPVDEPMAAEATRFLEETVRGKTLYLEWDAQRFDRYGRPLAYVYLSPETEQSVNAQILAKGLGQVMMFAPNTRYQKEFLALEAQARTQGVGIWRRE